MNWNAHISDDELLALVEQRSLPQSRRDAVAEALRSDPTLAKLIRDLRADRATLASLGEAEAMGVPAGLIDVVESRLERDALLGLSTQASAQHAPIPISSVQPSRPSSLTIAVRSPWTRRLALAACVAIVGFVGISMLRSGPAAKPRNPAPTDTIADAQPAPNDPSKTAKPNSTDLARSPDSPDHTMPPTPADVNGPAVADATDKPAADPVLAAKQDADRRADEARRFAAAVDAMRDGRLIVRVKTLPGTPIADKVTAMLDAFSARTSHSPLETRFAKAAVSESAVVIALVRRINAPASPIRLPGSSTDAPDRPIAATDPSKPPQTTARNERPNPVGLPDPTPLMLAEHAYAATLPAGESELRSLVRTLTQTGGKVEFDQASEPLPATAEVDTASLFWWKDRPASWMPRVRVPIVLQVSP